MTLYMTELTVSNFEASLCWYREGLGLTVERLDSTHRFALFASPGGRLAIKQGTPCPGGIIIHFQVDDLDEVTRQLASRNVVASVENKSSPEGYRRAKYHDPDGHAIVLFQWLRHHPT